MNALAGHGKDDRLIQAELPLVPNVGDRIREDANSPDWNKKIDSLVTEGEFIESVEKYGSTFWKAKLSNGKFALMAPEDTVIIDRAPVLVESFKIGDRVRDCDGFEGVITSLRSDHLTIENETNRYCYNLPLCKKPLHKLISHISTASAESEPLAKLADAQEKLVPSRTSTSTKRRNKSISPTSLKPQSMTISETIAQPKESISIQVDSHVPTLATLETEKGLTAKNLSSGLNICDVSKKDNPDLQSLKTPLDYLIAEWEQSYKAYPKAGTMRSGRLSQLPSLEVPKRGKEFLSLPTLTTGLGSGRNAGATKLEKWLKDKGLLLSTQALNPQMMAQLFGFPTDWTECLLESPKVAEEETTLEPCSGEQSISTVPQLSSNECSISIAASANNIDARLRFLLEQRDRLIASGASPQGVWLSVGQVYKKDFRQVVWKSAHEHEWLSGNKSRYIGKENSDEHKSAIAQHRAGQELRKIEREIKKLQVKS